MLQKQSTPCDSAVNKEEVEPLPDGSSPKLSDLIAARHSLSRPCDFSGITHIRLDRLGITSLPPGVVESLSSVTNWYLQHNQLTSLHGLESASKTRFICAAHNKLTTLAAVQPLRQLIFLDASSNQLNALNVEHLPKSVAFLRLLNNPLATPLDCQHKLLQHLPRLQELHLASSESDDDNESGSDEVATDVHALPPHKELDSTIINALEGMEREVWKAQSLVGPACSATATSREPSGAALKAMLAAESPPRLVRAAGSDAPCTAPDPEHSSRARTPSSSRCLDKSSAQLAKQSDMPSNYADANKASSVQMGSHLQPLVHGLAGGGTGGQVPSGVVRQRSQGAASARALLGRPPLDGRDTAGRGDRHARMTGPAVAGATSNDGRTGAAYAALQSSQPTIAAMSTEQMQDLITADLQLLQRCVECSLASGSVQASGLPGATAGSMGGAVEAMRQSGHQRARVHREQQLALASSINKLRVAKHGWCK
jgi:hypothetical protein